MDQLVPWTNLVIIIAGHHWTSRVLLRRFLILVFTDGSVYDGAVS